MEKPIARRGQQALYVRYAKKSSLVELSGEEDMRNGGHFFALAALASLATGCTAKADTEKSDAHYAGTPEDFMQISQLFSNYNYRIDNGDGEGWANLFTADGVFRDPSWCAIGHDQLATVVGTDKALGSDLKQFHMPSLGPITYQDRDHATVHSTVMVVQQKGFGIDGGVWVTGSYDDRLERVDGRWRFAYRLVKRSSDKPAIFCAREY